MKRTLISFSKLLLPTLLFVISSLQAQNWLWTKSAGNTNYEQATGTATDPFGNVFVVGYYRGNSIHIGSFTLYNTHILPSGFDYDGFIAKYDADGNVLWAKTHNVGSLNLKLATDALGNVYLAGAFGDTLIFANDTLINLYNNASMYLAKFDGNGNELWMRGAAGGEYSEAKAVAVDLTGNVYVAGEFRSTTITFGPMTLTNSNASPSAKKADMFLAKYDANGNVQWAQMAGGTLDDDIAIALSTDAIGNIFIGGEFKSDSITFGATVLKCTWPLQADVFLAKYDGTGNVRWAKKFGSTHVENVYGISTDAFGSCYIAGAFTSPSISFGSTIINNAFPLQSYFDAYIAKYDSSGNEIWAKATGGLVHDYGSVVTDASNHVYWYGSFEDQAIFGDDTLFCTTFMPSDIFVAKYDGDGNALWAKKAGGRGADRPNSASADAFGNVYLAGGFSSDTLMFDSSALFILNNYSDSMDIWVAKIGDLPTTVKNRDSVYKLEIYPNPTTSQLFIQTTNLQPQTISIFDMNGRKLREEVFSAMVDVSSLDAGIYFIELKDETRLARRRWVKE